MDAQTGITSDKDNDKGVLAQLHESVMIEIELDEKGIIRNCNNTCEQLVGFKREELVSRPVSFLIRKLSEYQIVLNHKLNPVLDYICHCGIPFQMNSKSGEAFFSQIQFVHLQHLKVPKVRLLASPMAPGHKGSMMMT